VPVYTYCTEPSRITEAPRSVKVLDNSVLSLVCQASGNPQPEISWSRGGRRIQPASVKRYTIKGITGGGGSVLRIQPVKARRDEGFIECVANNGVSQPATATASVHVYTHDNGQCYKLQLLTFTARRTAARCVAFLSVRLSHTLCHNE